MARDPAMLWYWGDWYSGTSLLSRFLKGCYMDILHANFNNGHLSIEEIKVCLGSDFGQSWPTLQKKFKQDEIGLFFNERIELEKEKRKEFSESRKRNVNKRYQKSTLVDTSVLHMYLHTDNENENENKDVFKEDSVLQKKGFNTMPKEIDIGELPQLKINAAIEIVKICKQVDIDINKTISMWKIFKIQNLTGKKYYQNIEAVQSHFINWIKTQNFKSNGKDKGHTAGKEMEFDAP